MFECVWTPFILKTVDKVGDNPVNKLLVTLWKSTAQNGDKVWVSRGQKILVSSWG